MSRSRYAEGVRALSVLTLAFAFVALAPRDARAGDAETCIGAIERGEPLKKKGQLVAARQELSGCAKATCPAAVREMCRAYLDEVDTAMPTVEIAAEDERGRVAASALTITIDGAARAPSGDGTYALDPGARTVRASYRGLVRESLVEVAPGRKRIPVVFRFEPPPVAPPPPLAKAPMTPAPPEHRSLAPAIGLGALGVLALGGGAVFGVKWSHDAECRPRCAPDETSRIRTDALLTDVLAGVGVVAAGAAIWWLLSAPPADSRATARREP